MYTNLKFNDGFISNDHIDQVLLQLDYFISRSQYRDMILRITSGVRTPDSQLRVIKGYAGTKQVFYASEISDDVNLKINIPNVGLVYTWQRTWSKLLNLGIIVNPPIDAICIDDYYKVINGLRVNRKGILIPSSPHIKGKAFDVSGYLGMDVTFALLDTAMKSGVGIINIVSERENNCQHCDIN